MPLSVKEHAHQLINKILVALTQEEVKEYIDNEMNELKLQKSGDPSSFAGILITELEEFNPMQQNAQQWSNIHMARIHLHPFLNGDHLKVKPL